MEAGNFWLRVARLFTLVFMLFCLMIFIAGVFYFQDYFANHAMNSHLGWTPDEMEAFLAGSACLPVVGPVEPYLSDCVCSFHLWDWFLIFLRKNDDWFSLYVAASFVLFGTFTGFPVSALAGTFPALQPIITPLAVAPG